MSKTQTSEGACEEQEQGNLLERTPTPTSLEVRDRSTEDKSLYGLIRLTLKDYLLWFILKPNTAESFLHWEHGLNSPSIIFLSCPLCLSVLGFLLQQSHGLGITLICGIPEWKLHPLHSCVIPISDLLTIPQFNSCPGCSLWDQLCFRS